MKVPVRIKGTAESNWQTVEMVNLSETGALLNRVSKRKPNDTIELALLSKDGATVYKASARVVWNEGDKMGIEFCDL